MRFTLPALVILGLALPVAASAQDALPPPITDRAEAEAFLAQFAGTWRGEGQSRTAFDEEYEQTLCNLTTTFDAGTDTLTNDGVCASTRGRVDIDGAITLNADGTLSGGFFSRFERAELVSSHGQLYQDRFFVEATYRIELNGQPRDVVVQVWVSEPVERANGPRAFGMIAQAQNPDTGQFVDFTNLVFSQQN